MGVGHVTSTQQIMETRSNNVQTILVCSFLDSLRNCWQPTAVHKRDAIIRLINTHLRMCHGRRM